MVKYIKVLDEIADNKDTVLDIVSELHAEYMTTHNYTTLVLEGDAKTYTILFKQLSMNMGKILVG